MFHTSPLEEEENMKFCICCENIQQMRDKFQHKEITASNQRRTEFTNYAAV
jgi:hypothetical protein